MTAPKIDRLPADFARWDELLALVTRAFAYMDGVIDPPSSATRLTSQSLAQKAKDEICYIATDNDGLVGCIFVAERDDCFYIGKLAIAKEWRGRGLGKALMQQAEQWASKTGKPVLELQTRVELAANQAAFGRLGFREVSRTAHEGYDQPTSITMRKVLA